MNRRAAVSWIVLVALLAWLLAGAALVALNPGPSLDKSGAPSGSSLQTKTLQKSAQKLTGSFQPITATATTTATVATSTATIALPTATDVPSPTPVPTDVPACAVLTHWSVAPGAVVHLSARPFGTAQRFERFMSIREQWPLPVVPLYGTHEILIDVPGPTATIWPTPEDDTPTPEPLPSQTAWVITATPEATSTAPPTASATLSTPPRAVLLPVVVRGFRRWEWWLP